MQMRMLCNHNRRDKMQQLMTIKELLNHFKMEANRKNTLRLLGVLKKLQLEENCEILKKMGKHYYVIMPNAKQAFPSLFEESNNHHYSAKEILSEAKISEAEKAIQQYSNVLRQFEKRISKLEDKIVKLEAKHST